MAREKTALGNHRVTSAGTRPHPPGIPAVAMAYSPIPSLAAVPAPGPGYLWVKTTPPFARLRIDGRESGATPMDTPLSVNGGTHRLEVEHEGCRTLAQEVRVAQGDTLVLRLSLQRVEEQAVRIPGQAEGQDAERHPERHVEAGP